MTSKSYKKKKWSFFWHTIYATLLCFDGSQFSLNHPTSGISWSMLDDCTADKFFKLIGCTHVMEYSLTINYLQWPYQNCEQETDAIFIKNESLLQNEEQKSNRRWIRVTTLKKPSNTETAGAVWRKEECDHWNDQKLLSILNKFFACRCLVPIQISNSIFSKYSSQETGLLKGNRV